MWDWENGWKSTRKFEDAHSSSVMQIAFNPNDAKAFASVSKDYTLKVCV
jgi:WD40 repeat protein